MKKLSTYLLAAAVLFAAGCENNIPDTGSINNAPVSEVVLDEALAAGIEIQRGATYSVPEHISYLPIDATNTAQYYTSSDENIASITPEGILTGVSVGSCSITVRIGNAESDVMATFDVTVKEPDYIAIASLRFTNENPEYDIDGGTVDINNILYVGSADEVEYATETILFTSSDESVATIDEDGIITIHKLGQTTITAAAEFSNVTPAVVTVKFYRMVEYLRFPGDGDGNGDGVNDGSPRAIMGSSATEWDAMPHSDGGWEMIEFDWLGGGHKDGWANTGQRNCYRYAMLDNRRIVSRCRTVIMYGTTNRIAQQAFFGLFIGLHGIFHALQAIFLALLGFGKHVGQIAHDLTLRLGILLFLFGQTHLRNISDFATLGDAHLLGLFCRKDPVDTTHKHIVGRVGTGNLIGLHGTRNRTAGNTSRLVGNNRFPLTWIHPTDNGGAIVATANRGLDNRSTTRGSIGSARYNGTVRTGVVNDLLVRKPGQLGVIVIHYEILLRVEMLKREMIYQ